MFIALSVFLFLTAAMAWSNERWLKLPTAVGVTLMSALASTLTLVWHHQVSPLTSALSWTAEWKFNDLFMHGVLCFLLFASALHVDIHMLRKERIMIFVLSTVGVVLSASMTGTLLYLVLHMFGVVWPWVWCFLFGVIISPTDAVVAADALKRASLTERLKAKILGESLFNDGTAVVLFSLVLSFVVSNAPHPFFDITVPFLSNSYVKWPAFFLWQGVGGAAVGIGVGAIFLYAISTVNQATVELLLTLACATVTYALADLLAASAPIAVVFAGLAVGHHGRKFAMSEHTQQRVFSFWELLDELMNVGLFVLIGVQLLKLDHVLWHLTLMAIPIALLARYSSVAIPVMIARPFRSFSKKSILWMTWGGLRGGISLALAMSVPVFPGANLLLSLTYVVVVFSIVVQGGFILPWLARRHATLQEEQVS
jgi:CPA1 family monovalent cation:H+ antiporter